MTSFNFIYGFLFDTSSDGFYKFLFEQVGQNADFDEYMNSIMEARDDRPHNRQASFKDFCQSDYFDSYEFIKNQVHDDENKWLTTYMKMGGKIFYLHGVGISFNKDDIDKTLNFGSIEDLMIHVPEKLQEDMVEQRNVWSGGEYPGPAKLYIKTYTFHI